MAQRLSGILKRALLKRFEAWARFAAQFSDRFAAPGKVSYHARTGLSDHNCREELAREFVVILQHGLASVGGRVPSALRYFSGSSYSRKPRAFFDAQYPTTA